MELRHLRYFRAVAELGGFGRAARQLHVAQSAISGQIRDLEHEIQVELFDRSQREIALTAEGSLFLDEAREILERVERAVALAQRASRGQIGTLTVGLCGPSTSPFLPQLVRSFRTRSPGVQIVLKEMNPSAQLQALAAGSLDVGFTRGLEGAHDSLAGEVLYTEPIVAALPDDHPRAADRISLKCLANERFVLYFRAGSPVIFDTILGMCKRSGFSPALASQPEILQTVLTLVEAGEGVALVPRCISRLSHSSLRFCAVKPEERLDVTLTWNQAVRSAARDAFLELVRERSPEIRAMME